MSHDRESGRGLNLESKDRVCWIGDSITRDGRFHSIVNRTLLASGHVPDVQFFNCGLSGDTAEGALRRLEYDVIPHRPTVAFVMFGMNDVRRELYGDGHRHAADDGERRLALTKYREILGDIIGHLRGSGARVVLMTPSPYDQVANLASENLRGVDDALRECSRHARELAISRGLECIELHRSMSVINSAIQAIDRDFTLIGADRVHPGMACHALMADEILSSIGYVSASASIDIDHNIASDPSPSGCSIEYCERSSDRIVFDVSIPWIPSYPTPLGILGNTWKYRAMRRSSLRLRVSGLEGSSYAVSVDGSLLVNATGESLKKGIDILDHAKSPLWNTWSEMSGILDEAHRLESDALRHLVGVDHFVLRPDGIDPSDEVRARIRVARQLDENRASGHAYGVWQCGFWLRNSPGRKHVAHLISRLMARVRALAVPQTHCIAIEPDRSAEG